MKMSNGPKKDDELKKCMQKFQTPPVVREKKNEGVVSPRKRKLNSDLCGKKESSPLQRRNCQIHSLS